MLHSFGRAHALIKQAIEWENPRIGREGSTSTLDTTRGIMWRYAIAYCGWDRCTNTLGITQATQEGLFAKSNHHLESPKLTDKQRRQILAWIPDQGIIAEDNDELSINGTWIRDFLGIRQSYQDFPDWLLGEKRMSQAALLAVLRNIVCHGSLLPTKATSWGFVDIYKSGIKAIGEGFQTILVRIIPREAVIRPTTGSRKT